MDLMKQSVAVSVLFHIVVAGTITYGLPSVDRTLHLPPPAIPVEIVKIDDVRRSTQKQTEKKADSRPVSAKAQPKASTKVASKSTDSVPLPDAKPRKKPKQDDKPEAAPSLSVTPRTKPSERKSLDTNRLAALIDRSIKDDPAPQVDTRKELEKKLEEAIDKPIETSLMARQATAELEDAIRQRVEKCWIVPAGAKASDKQVIPIRLWLNTDGTLLRQPQLMDKSGMSDNFYRAAAESALRAVRMCAPYELPKDRYNLWREITLNFDPSDFMG